MAEKQHSSDAPYFFSFDSGWPTYYLVCGIADRMSVFSGDFSELAHHLLLPISGGTNPLLDGNSGRPQPTCTMQGLESSSDLTKF
jgi:hypothetical protein